MGSGLNSVSQYRNTGFFNQIARNHVQLSIRLMQMPPLHVQKQTDSFT